MLEPARNTQAAKLKRVFVLPFEGYGGAEVATEIEAQLVSVEVNNNHYFIVLERSQLGRVYKEIEIAQSGLVDQRTAIKVGKLVGAEAIYTGRVSQYGVSDSRYSQKRQKCAAYENSNKFFKKCLNWVNYAVPCVKKSAIFSFTPKLFEVETGQVVYSRTINQEVAADVCNDGQSQPIDETTLMNTARIAAISEFIQDVAPNYHNEEVVVMDSAGQLGDQSKEAFRSGVAFARKNRMDRACALWKRAAELSNGPKEPSLAYNLGLCYEIDGLLEQALSQYKSADQMLSRPNSVISQGLQRVQHKIEQRSVLDQQI